MKSAASMTVFTGTAPPPKEVLARGLQDVVIVFHVGLVVDLDEHVAPSAVEHPLSGRVHGAQHGLLALQPLVLAKVKESEDHGHAELVRPLDHPLQPREAVVPQRAIGLDGRVVPGLLLRVALGRAALEVDREGEQPVPPPLRHRGDELARVALGIPGLGVRVGPHRGGFAVPVIEDALHHS
jgi:hypothetical protein